MGRLRKAPFCFTSIIIILLIANACSLERELANEFIKTKSRRAALLIVPEIIFKTNLNTKILDSLKITDKSLFDSVLYAHSRYLQHINDSTFIYNYLMGFSKEFSKFGFDVYLESNTAEFMKVDSNAYLINIAQLELEEVLYPVRDETVLYETYYYHDQKLNGVYINSWFEISQINDTIANDQVYFASDLITDDLESDFTFNIFSGGVTYVYKIDSLEYDELYKFAFVLGRTYAGYTFDLLLNRYIDARLPGTKTKDEEFWRYDPYMETLFIATDDRLVPLDE